MLGAGTHTTEISGATIQVDPSQLPIKNLPVFQISLENDVADWERKIPLSIKEALEIYDHQKEGQNIAFNLTDVPYLSFRDVQRLAQILLTSTKNKVSKEQPLVVVMQSDHAKVLGQTMKFIEESQSIICIDQVEVEHGDYLDIGSVLRTEVVPVVVKTLTFHT